MQLDLVVAASNGVIIGRVLASEGAPVADAFTSATRMNDNKAANRSAGSKWPRVRRSKTSSLSLSEDRGCALAYSTKRQASPLSACAQPSPPAVVIPGGPAVTLVAGPAAGH